MPFQPGNTLGQSNKKARIWLKAINDAIAKRLKTDPEALEKLADKLLVGVDNGDMGAIRELGDRLDGKVPQALVGGDDDSAPIRLLTNSDADIIARYQQISSQEKTK